jgi:hypothetical protein
VFSRSNGVRMLIVLPTFAFPFFFCETNSVPFPPRVRYKTAQLKLVDIMHRRGAGPEKPILRQILREEARKDIGDTGLLDHLLKVIRTWHPIT